ncbi:MAG: hypothetical protein Q8L41_13985 [Anaerolineales bacterium]|nr:hypothetical protein [Anaerolineales bacterium]
MKQTSLLLLLSIFLASCANVATSAPAAPDSSTLDSTPTPQSTETQTVVPTATEMPDPNMPLGEMGKDAEGKYVKMENGDIARKVEYKNSAGEILYEGWAVEKTQKGGITLLGTGGPYRAVPVKLMIASNVSGGEVFASLTSPDNPDSGFDSLNSVVGTALRARKNISNSDLVGLNDYIDKLRKGELSLPFITSFGKSVEGFLGPDTGFITIVVPYDSLDPATVNGVTEWLDAYPESRSSFRSTVLGVDKDGNIVGLIASKKPLNELPDNITRMLLLYHAANIINDEDQTHQEWSNNLSIYILYADAKGDKKVPDIIITRNP